MICSTLSLFKTVFKNLVSWKLIMKALTKICGCVSHCLYQILRYQDVFCPFYAPVFINPCQSWLRLSWIHSSRTEAHTGLLLACLETPREVTKVTKVQQQYCYSSTPSSRLAVSVWHSQMLTLLLGVESQFGSNLSQIFRGCQLAPCLYFSLKIYTVNTVHVLFVTKYTVLSSIIC